MCRIIAFHSHTVREFNSKEDCARSLRITIRTVNRHLADGKPLRGGWFVDEAIDNEDYNPCHNYGQKDNSLN
ncbi:MAG: hypothetical protein IKB95_04855 [Bacteroidales bacterium]|nr:hypothetical protein [Bacteroidales bacterium]